MSTRVKIERKKSDAPVEVSEVKTTLDAAEANRLLASGWRLLHGGVSHLDDYGLNVKPIFILGRIAK